MNLLYIRPKYMGGTVRYAFSLFAEFISMDCFEWYVYVRDGVDLPPEFYRPDVNLQIIRIRGSFVGRIAYEQLFLPLRAGKDKLDLLFSPGFVSPLWGAYVKVVTVHDLYFRLYPQFVRPWQRRYWRLFIPFSLRTSDAVVTISRTTYRDLVSYYPWLTDKLHTIYLGVTGVSSLNPVSEIAARERYCLVVGNITPNKNIGVVIDAVKKINQDGTRCRLRIIGDDIFGGLDKYLEQSSEYELIDMNTGLSDEELSAAYRGALCTIQASMYEGFGLPVLEAMAQGSPVIISDADALVEIAGGAALVFSRDSKADGLYSCIRQLMKEEGLRDHYRELGLQRAGEFSWAATAKNTTRLFQSLLND